MGYDEWLSHNPADDGVDETVKLYFECDNEYDATPDGDDETWTACGFEGDVEVTAWISRNYKTGEWTCPKCDRIQDFEIDSQEVLG